MNIEREYHAAAFWLLPAIGIITARCECCDEDSGTVISLTWLWFTLHLCFTKGHDE